MPNHLLQQRGWGRRKPGPGNRLDRAHPLCRGLVSCNLLAEGGGAALYDLALARPSAVWGNAPAWRAGLTGPCLHFTSASSQYVRLDPGAVVSTGNAPFTVGVLYRCSDTGTAELDLFAEGSGSTNNPWMNINLNSGTNGKLMVTLRNDAGTGTFPNATSAGYVNGAWHLVHAVNEGNGGNVRLYLDGLQVASSANSLGASLTTTKAAIGASDRTSIGNPFNGDVGAQWSWNRALTAGEIGRHWRDWFGMMTAPQPLRRYVAGSVYLDLGGALLAGRASGSMSAHLLEAGAASAAGRAAGVERQLAADTGGSVAAARVAGNDQLGSGALIIITRGAQGDTETRSAAADSISRAGGEG